MSYSALRPDGVAQYTAAQASTDERLTYLKKVYGLTFVGILFFAITISLTVAGGLEAMGQVDSLYIPLFTELFYLSMWLGQSFFIPLALIIGSSFLVHKVSMVKGVNLVGYFGFIGLWSILTVPLVIYALGVGGLAIIFQAAGLTTFVFGGLTGYVLITRKDFSFMGGFLTVGLFLILGTIIMLGILNLLGVQMPTFVQVAISIFVVLLFSGYVLYDTSRILHHYATDMVVPAALALSVDFIILFRQILFLLAMSRD